MKQADIRVSVTRGRLTESVHQGCAAIVHVDDALKQSPESKRVVTFARSAAKPLQALALITSGAAQHWKLTDEEIALICASHNGEDVHVGKVLGLLQKIGLSSDSLQCGVHEPYHHPTAELMKRQGFQPSALHNNCSGKHAGMIALCAYKKWDSTDYTSKQHPVQQLMLQTVSQMCGMSPNEIETGTDGCGVPVFGLPIERLAYAYSRLACPINLPEPFRLACSGIVDAIRSHPHLLAGDDRFDTQLVRVTNGKIIGKMGAEGVFAIAVPSACLGIALKISDGSMRALYPAAVEVLYALRLITAEEANKLQTFHKPVIFNRRGEQVGSIEPQVTFA